MAEENKTILSPEKIKEHSSTDTDVLVDEIISRVKQYSPSANTDIIYVAYLLAKNAHKNQFRKSGDPYIEHPVQVAYIASQIKLDAVTICACLLHDVIEDTPYTYEDIQSSAAMWRSLWTELQSLLKLSIIRARNSRLKTCVKCFSPCQRIYVL